MKQIITFLLATTITITAFSQKAKPEFKGISGAITLDIDSVKETTPLLPISDLTSFSNYLKDKLLARDYEIVMAAINELYGRRIKEFYDKQKK